MLISALVFGGCLWYKAFDDDSADSTLVPPPTADERAQTVPILAQATASQRICYGWQLGEYYRDRWTFGSNLGDEVTVRDDPRCPRWVEVRVGVTYTAESSEIEDSASVDVIGSADIDPADLDAVENGLERFGLDSDVFVDDPGWAVCRAAVALPLLMAEAGMASPVVTPSADPAARVAPLPDAGSDFWRDRWAWLLGGAVLLLVAALLLTVGFVQRSRHHSRPHIGPVQRVK